AGRWSARPRRRPSTTATARSPGTRPGRARSDARRTDPARRPAATVWQWSPAPGQLMACPAPRPRPAASVPRGAPRGLPVPGGRSAPTLAGMEQPPSLTAGLTAQVELTVTDADTAQAMGSGDVPVLGTPRALALAEAATVAATAVKLPAGSTTVGTRVELEHTAPSPVGAKVTATATLAKVDGRRLLFEVRLSSGGRTVAE